MTSNEMHLEFNILYDKITSLSAPGYTDQEVSLILSKAQEVYVKGGYSPFSDFEETEKRKKDFSELKAFSAITTQSSVQTGVHTNGVFFDLPTNFLYSQQEEIIVSSSDDCVDGNTLEVVPISEDEYNRIKDNPFKKATTKRALRMEQARQTVGTNPKRHEIITDGSYTVTTYNVRYLRRPVEIVTTLQNDSTTSTAVDSELDASTHREIIDIAVRIATSVTNPGQYPQRISEENRNKEQTIK